MTTKLRKYWDALKLGRVSKKHLLFFSIALVLSLTFGFSVMSKSSILEHTVDPQSKNLRLYWKNDSGDKYMSFKNLDDELESDSLSLVFAMNGGMFMENRAPLGLYVEEGEKLAKLNTVQEAYGNFYLQPNGVFGITTDHKAFVCVTGDYESQEKVDFATQSGPMLVIDGKMHPAFKEGSSNLHVRNGVGILPDGKVLFAMSEQRINFYDFASFFIDKGCKNALYLDGFVSRTFLPKKGYHSKEGRFGVIIAETAPWHDSSKE